MGYYEKLRRWTEKNPFRALAIKMRSFRKHFHEMPEKQQKRRARDLLRMAVRLEIIARPSVCAHCYKAAKVSAHHESYRDVLKVVWLCRQCHAKADHKREKRLGIVRNFRGYVKVPASVHREAWRLWKEGKLSQVAIGRLLGISNASVSLIVRGLTKPRD
jgi:hypothetical protein